MSVKIGVSQRVHSSHSQQRPNDRSRAGSKPQKKTGEAVLRSVKQSVRRISKVVKNDIKEAKKIWLPWPAILCLFVQRVWIAVPLPANLERRCRLWFFISFEMEVETARMVLGNHGRCRGPSCSVDSVHSLDEQLGSCAGDRWRRFPRSLPGLLDSWHRRGIRRWPKRQ